MAIKYSNLKIDDVPVDGETNRSISSNWAADHTADLNAHNMIVAAPASKTASGTAGQMAYDGTYLYTCVDTDTWRRNIIAQWS